MINGGFVGRFARKRPKLCFLQPTTRPVLDVDMEEMEIPDLLHPHQKEQIARELSKVMAAGFGSLDLDIRDGKLRFVMPGPEWPRPDYRFSYPSVISGLDELLGAWREAFYLALAEVFGKMNGRLIIRIEYGQVLTLSPVPSLRARTGKTGELKQ